MEREKITKKEIKEVLIENKGLLRRYGVKKMGLFGSYVKGWQKEDSDIDILVEVEGISLLDFVALELKLSEILGRKIDLVSIKALKPYIKPYILKEVEYIEGLQTLPAGYNGSNKKITKYTDEEDFETFIKDDKTVDAVIRNLEIIGEAVKNIPEEVKEEYPDIRWKDIAGMRDKLIQ